PTKEVIEKLKAAGVSVKAASSSVDEATAARVLGNGGLPAGDDGGSAPAPAPTRSALTHREMERRASPLPTARVNNRRTLTHR
ncbi:MAG: translation initiation factor IF-2 N-terminal domain-containing protein, partial [Solirubrobacteraceae bacterium]